MGKKRPSTEEIQMPMEPNLSLRGIDKPEDVLKACLPALRKQFNEPTLGFTSVDRTARVKRYALCGVNQKIGTAREQYRILPLYISTSAFYWAGITVDFQFLISSHQLIDAGIIIFKGDAIADKIPVLRAEWHCADECLQAIHAQPHWHVYYPPLRYLGVGFSPDYPKDFDPDELAEDEGDSEAQLMRFHFAMSAEWQRGDQNAHVRAITSATALGGWLCGCLSYIVGELS